MGRNDRPNVKPFLLTVDPEKLATHKPTTHIKPYDVPFHLRQGFESELLNMLDAGILTPCDTPTAWNAKAFPVQTNSDPTKCRIIGDFRGLNRVLLKLYWHTESSNQLLRHIDPNAKVFCIIDATSRFHQCPVDPETSKLLTIVTNAGQFSYQVLPHGVCNSSDLWNILTDGNSSIDSDLAILKNMKFAQEKNLKLNPKKFFVSEQEEFGGSTVSAEK